MGKNGDITITNLKSSTGIADDRLSAHHPNGTGNQTKFGDFLITDIGGNTSPSSVNGVSTGDQFSGSHMIPSKVLRGGTSKSVSGSYNSNDYWEFSNIQLQSGDKVHLAIWTEFTTNRSEHFIEQIGKRQANWSFGGTSGYNIVGFQNADFNNTHLRKGSGYEPFVFVLKVPSGGGPFTVGLNFNYNLNSDVTQRLLQFPTRDVDSSLDVTLTTSVDTTNDEIDFTFEVASGQPAFDFTLENTDQGYFVVSNKTVSATPTFTRTFTDTQADTTIDNYDWEVVDDNGDKATGSVQIGLPQ
jgi:hypothetical protein